MFELNWTHNAPQLAAAKSQQLKQNKQTKNKREYLYVTSEQAMCQVTNRNAVYLVQVKSSKK